MASTTADTLDALAQKLARAAKDIRSGSLSLETDTFQRMGLINAATELSNAVSLPKDKILMWLPYFAHITAIRLFVKWEAFEKIPIGSGAAISYTELAEKLGADESLITRFARALVANGTLEQIGADCVGHTEFSKTFTTPNPIWAMVQLGFDHQLSSFLAMPKYFDQFGLAEEPKDRLQTVQAFSEGRLGSTVWEIHHSSEERLKVMTLSMAAVEEHMPALGGYDLSWAVNEANESADRVLVVDVGGGKGQALKGIFKATPGLPQNRCVLEDLPEVIEAARQDDSELADVQMVAMDFHNEQPVKGKKTCQPLDFWEEIANILILGALVYYMRRCLHDYSDEECVIMLQQIAGAMAVDSRLLIVETLLGNPLSSFQAAMDLMMMVISGKERTLENFQDVLGIVGLKITKVSQIPGGNAVIECALA